MDKSSVIRKDAKCFFLSSVHARGIKARRISRAFSASRGIFQRSYRSRGSHLAAVLFEYVEKISDKSAESSARAYVALRSSVESAIIRQWIDPRALQRGKCRVSSSFIPLIVYSTVTFCLIVLLYPRIPTDLIGAIVKKPPRNAALARRISSMRFLRELYFTCTL